jgi:MFS family permease
VLKLAAAGQAIAVGATGIVAMDGISSAWSVLPIVGLSGVASAFVHPSLQALTADVAGPGRGLAGISLQQTGSRAIGVLGALLAGIASDQAGAAPALFGAAGVYAVSAAVMGRVKVDTAPGPVSRPRLLAEVASGVRVMASTPPVAVLLVMAMVVEMFGFAYNAVLPAVARDVLHVRAAGYGSLSFMAGIGAVAGVTVLSLTANRAGRSATLVAITIGFGCALIAFAASSSFALSLALVTCIGAMAAMFDSMQWALLQANVPDAMRGRAVAAWVFAIGFGWVGHLSLGVMAEEVSVRWALAASGGTVIVTGVLALFVFRRIRVA